MSKIVLPESETPKTLGKYIHPHYEKERNVFEAVINGANAGVRLIAGIVALLIAVLGLVALINIFLLFFFSLILLIICNKKTFSRVLSDSIVTAKFMCTRLRNVHKTSLPHAYPLKYL